MTKTYNIEKLIELGANRWTKYGKDRLYLRHFIMNNLDYKIDKYNTGNIRYAELKGEKISNSMAVKLFGSFGDAYIDLTTGKIYTNGPKEEEAIELIEELLEQVEKETEEETEEVEETEETEEVEEVEKETEEETTEEKEEGEEEMTKRINLEEVLGFVANGEDCKVMMDDGQVDVYPANAQGYGEVIITLEAYDFEECDNAEEFAEWVNDGLRSTGKDFELK